MNIREIEALLRELYGRELFRGDTFYDARLTKAIAWCQSRQRATLKRKAIFKHRADEKRELLR